MKYPIEIEKIYKDIVELTVQGATNVAIASLEGMKLALQNDQNTDGKVLERIVDVGKLFSLCKTK